MPAARQADLGPLPGLVGFAAGDAQPQTAADLGDILDLQGERVRSGAARRRSRTAGASGRAGRGRKHRRWRPAGAAWRATARRPFATGRPCRRSKACSGPWMSRCAGVPGQVVEAVRLADRRQAPADRRRGMAFGQAGEVGADRRRRGRHRGEVFFRAPGGVMRPVGPVGAQRRRGRRLAGQGARRRERGETRRGRRETSVAPASSGLATARAETSAAGVRGAAGALAGGRGRAESEVKSAMGRGLRRWAGKATGKNSTRRDNRYYRA